MLRVDEKHNYEIVHLKIIYDLFVRFYNHYDEEVFGSIFNFIKLKNPELKNEIYNRYDFNGRCNTDSDVNMYFKVVKSVYGSNLVIPGCNCYKNNFETCHEKTHDCICILFLN